MTNRVSTAAPAVVIGGGLAGAALGARLAQAGREVVVLEREPRADHKVCGEFLSYEAGLYLSELGLDLDALGAAPIRSVRLFAGRATAQADLPFRASSLSRRALDGALLSRAEALGAQVRRGTRVTALRHRPEGGFAIRTDTGEEIVAAHVFLATGKHDLRDWRRPPGLQSDLIGFKMHWRMTPAQTAAVEGQVELHLFPGGYAGLEPVEDGVVNLCLLVQRRRFASLGQSWDGLIRDLRARCKTLGARLDGAVPCFTRPLAISAIPYGYVGRRAHGLWRLGDQAAVIPSFAGDGMSIALHSARLAADMFLSGSSPDRFQRALAGDVGAQVVQAAWMSKALVQAWAQPTLAAAIRLRPQTLARVAGATRIPSHVMARTLN